MPNWIISKNYASNQCNVKTERHNAWGSTWKGKKRIGTDTAKCAIAEKLCKPKNGGYTMASSGCAQCFANEGKHDKNHRLHEIKTIWMQCHSIICSIRFTRISFFHTDLTVFKSDTHAHTLIPFAFRCCCCSFFFRLFLFWFFYLCFSPLCENISNSIFGLSFGMRYASTKI